MKILAINGSPRMNNNTATLLKHALEGAESKGAETELVNLYKLNYKGCVSCFACKLKNAKNSGKCSYRDELSPILEKAIEADVLILGSSIYYHFVTGEMRSFMERLMFPLDSYVINKETGLQKTILDKVKPVGFIYTMNAPKFIMEEYKYPTLMEFNEHDLKRIFGYCEQLCSMDTYQFNDYSKYEMTLFDEKEKSKVRESQFPIDCKKAFDLGVRLVEEAEKVK